MNTKTIISKREALLCCLFLFLIIKSQLNAQIIYTDLPDATPNASYSLDLNNDTIVDFIIQLGGSNGNYGVQCYPQNNNAYSGQLVDGIHCPWALSDSQQICDTLSTWYNADSPGTMGLGSNTGYWPGVTNKYLGLKLSVGINTYYGWARLDCFASSSSFTIKDYAYESKPDVCIQAGEISLGINKIIYKNPISIFPNPCNTSTTIQTIGNSQNTTLTIYNAFGHITKQIKEHTGESIYLSRDNLPSGLYYIKMTKENQTIAIEKLIIKD